MLKTERLLCTNMVRSVNDIITDQVITFYANSAFRKICLVWSYDVTDESVMTVQSSRLFTVEKKINF